jgi:hypothetical protein
MLRYFCGLRTKNAVCVNAVGVHAIYGHITDAGDADGHAVGVRAVGARVVFVHAVGKPNAGAHAVVVRAIMYMSTVYLLCCRFPYCT